MPFRFVALLAATTALLLAVAGPAAAGEAQQSDRTLLTRLKEHGLWAGPVSRLAGERAVNRRVRDVAVRIADEESRLDVALRAAADRLAVTLPSEPTDEERGWAEEIGAAQGDTFDHLYVNRLRAEYGSLFALAGEVRAGTRNDDVRAFAQTAVDTALRHLTLLESTGLAETTSLLVAADAGDGLGGGQIAAGAVLVALTTVATFGMVRLLGSPGEKQPRTRR